MAPMLKIGGRQIAHDEYVGVSDLTKTDELVGERVDGILNSSSTRPERYAAA
jgi:hypothetical protein